MIKLDELNEAILECENADRHTYDDCIRLAALYTIRRQLYGDSENTAVQAREKQQDVIGNYGDSDFLQLSHGKSVEKMMAIFDELMTALEITNTRLYDGVMRKIAKEE